MGGHLVESELNDEHRDADDREETDRELPRSSFHRLDSYAACACATLGDSCSLSLHDSEEDPPAGVLTAAALS